MAELSAEDRREPGRAAAPSARRSGGPRRWLPWLIAVLVLAVLLVVLFRALQPKKKPEAPHASPVGVAKAVTGDMAVRLEGLGTVTPTSTVTVQTQISGQILKVGFKEGDVVRKGQLLVQIDPRPYEVLLQQYQGALAHDQGLLDQARSDLARYLQEDRVNSIAKQTVSDQEFLVKQDEGTVIEDKAEINTEKLNLTYCHITAPATGRVGLRLVDPGNYVQAGSATGLVVLTTLQPITVVFTLPEDQASGVMAAAGGGKGLVVEALDRSDNQTIATGRLLAVDNTVDTTTGTVKLRAEFDNADLKLFPNEFVNARLDLETLRNVTKIPVRALQYGAPGTFVYVVEKGAAQVRKVKTGVTEGESVEVTSGVQPGEEVVVDGTDLLRPGAKVRVTSGASKHQPKPNNGPGAAPGQQPQNAPAATGGAG